MPAEIGTAPSFEEAGWLLFPVAPPLHRDLSFHADQTTSFHNNNALFLRGEKNAWL
jgi:hypothetical protein